MSRSRLVGRLLTVVAVISALVAGWLVYQQVTYTPTMSTPSASSPPSEEPLPSVTTPPIPTQTPTPDQESDVNDPRGKPVSLTIKRGKKTVVKTMPFAPRVVDSVHPGWFSSRCGAVAYWDNPGWPKPGVESLKKALVTGHVMCGPNAWYPLQHLQPSKDGAPGGRQGDLLYIQYSSDDLVVAEAYEDSHDVPKGNLNKMPKYIENGGKKAREIRLTTCDRTGAIRVDGHAVNNIVQRFRVIAVIRAGEDATITTDTIPTRVGGTIKLSPR